jgi:hypothetical protein
MLDWILYNEKYENDKRCHHKLGLVGGVEVGEVQRNLVDLESELRGQNHVIYRCPEKKHQLENNGINKPYVKVEQKFCKKEKEVKTQFKSLKDCQMVDFRNVGMDGCPNI